MCGFKFLDFEVPGVFNDIPAGSGESGPVLQLDQALILEQQQRAGLIGGVVGHGDNGFFLEGGKISAPARVDAEGLVMHRADGNKVHALFLHEIV